MGAGGRTRRLAYLASDGVGRWRESGMIDESRLLEALSGEGEAGTGGAEEVGAALARCAGEARRRRKARQWGPCRRRERGGVREDFGWRREGMGRPGKEGGARERLGRRPKKGRGGKIKRRKGKGIFLGFFIAV